MAWDDDYCCPDCGCDPCGCDWERIEQERHDRHAAFLRGLSDDELGKQWQRECSRHDSAVDRCEQINSPTIEDSAGWMDFIEREFAARGRQYFDFTAHD